MAAVLNRESGNVYQRSWMSW